jgi:hypothetical protein
MAPALGYRSCQPVSFLSWRRSFPVVSGDDVQKGLATCYPSPILPQTCTSDLLVL